MIVIPNLDIFRLLRNNRKEKLLSLKYLPSLNRLLNDVLVLIRSDLLKPGISVSSTRTDACVPFGAFF